MADIITIAKEFLDYSYVSHSALGCGHINSTFLLEMKDENGNLHKFVLQKINSFVFPDVEGLMNNICSVTKFIKSNLPENSDPEREVMTVIPTKSGKQFFKYGEEYWRCYIFIDNTVTYQQIENPIDFYNCGYAFGNFQQKLATFPAEKLSEPIKDFHNTVSRFAALKAAVAADPLGRAKSVLPEIDFCFKREALSHAIKDELDCGNIPLRVTHNDTKLNNILFDEASNLPLCVIDLDTIMPGAACYDFGDCIRFGASSAPEDEKDLSKVYMDLSLFDTFAKGYLSVAKSFLSKSEIPSLATGSAVMTFECGMRFLTDYILGDKYFKLSYPEQNLDRCRTQLKLVEDMESKMGKMLNCVKKYAEE